MTIAAGDLRHRVFVEQKVASKDPNTGEPIYAWTSFVNDDQGDPLAVPANIAPVSAREFLTSQAVQSEITTRITIRWLPGITAAMRLRQKGSNTIYNIAGILKDLISGREALTLPCSEGTNDG